MRSRNNIGFFELTKAGFLTDSAFFNKVPKIQNGMFFVILNKKKYFIMGNNSQAFQNYSRIKKFINSSRFNEAFLLLKKSLVKFPSLYKDLDNIKGSESTYRYMLDYLAEGNSDPSYNDMIIKIRESLTNANELLLREETLADSSDIYSSTVRLNKLRNESFLTLYDKLKNNLLEDQKVSEETGKIVVSEKQMQDLDEIFKYLWSSLNVSPDEYVKLNEMFEDENVPEYIKSLLVSAIILGNLSYFDPKKYEILLNLYDSVDTISIKSKTIVGIVLIALMYPDRIVGNLSLKSRLLLTADDDEFKTLTNNVLLSIIRTYDTTRIDNKMRNEVMPGLMKIKPDLIDKIKNMASDAENFLSDDANPQWEELFENSDLGEKLQEINQLQMEGADVMVTAFSNLKNFPFFNNISNWFVPFIPENFEFADLNINKNDEILEHLSLVMCESDIHSYLLSLRRMPEDQRLLMFSNLEKQMKEAKEAMTSPIGDTPAQKMTRKIRHTLQDLYRFFKFFRKKEEFKDPFASPITASNIIPLLGILGISSETIRLAAEFYFKNNYYYEAASLFEFIDSKNPEIQIWEKLGYCYDRLKMYGEAVKWYSKAEIVNPQNLWLNKKLALALKNSGNPTEALKFYERALEKEPENYHLIMSAGQCLLEMEEYEEALNKFYHAQYLKPEKLSPLRASAWATLLSGNTEKAIGLYENLCNLPGSDKNDLLNAAHCNLTNGNFKEALKYYRSFVESSENKDITNLVLAFKEDNNVIKKLGIQTSDLRLIIDKLRYERE